MDREEYVKKAKNILESDRSMGQYHRLNFQNYNYGENSPVNSKILTNMPHGSKVIIEEKVYEAMDVLAEVTNEDGKECSFLLTGQVEGQTAIFDGLIMQGNDGNAHEAGFSKIAPELSKFMEDVKRNNVKNAIVCHGHSHPKVGQYYMQFSLGDLASYIQMNKDNEQYRDKEVELCSCLLTDGEFNFLFYDNKTNNFYKFNNTYMRKKDGELVKLPSYGQKSKSFDDSDQDR